MTIDEHSSPILEFSEDLSQKQSTDIKLPSVKIPDKTTGLEKPLEILPVIKTPVEKSPIEGAEKPKSASQLLNKFINTPKETSEADQPSATTKEP
jgi:hypothetical protein